MQFGWQINGKFQSVLLKEKGRVHEFTSSPVHGFSRFNEADYSKKKSCY